MVVYISEPEMLTRFVDGLKVAAGSAHQLAHAQQNPQWLSIRDFLEAIIEKGQKIAVAKSLKRDEVLTKLDERQTKLKPNGG